MDNTTFATLNITTNTTPNSEKIYFVNETGVSLNLTAAEACAKSESVSNYINILH